MTHRILDPAEWPRLDGTELEGVWKILQPDRAQVLVVEDGDGAIVGCWALVWALHAEGCWIAPRHRLHSSVARHLWVGLHELGVQMAAGAVWTGTKPDDLLLSDLLERHGAQSMNEQMRSYVLPLIKGDS